jgi:hypothetical protein
VNSGDPTGKIAFDRGSSILLMGQLLEHGENG